MLGNSVFIIAAFIVVISVIVAIHEYGHYIVGRWCGIHAETFSLGFGKVLFSRTDKHGTKWQVAALPFGGYVKFLGDANAASYGSTEVAPEVNPRNTMHGAPLWARTATVAAGPIFNFILAIAIWAGYLLYEGKPTEDLVFEADYAMPARFASELKAGDQIISIGGIPVGEEGQELEIAPRIDYEVIRDGQTMTVQGPYLVPPRASGVAPRSAADRAGIKIDDVIVAANGQEIWGFGDVVEVVNVAEGEPIALTVWRAGDELDFTLAPRRTDLPLADGGFETRWLIGITGTEFFESAKEPYGVWEAVNDGTSQLWLRLKTTVSALGHVIVGDISTCNLSGPVGIAQMSGAVAQQGTLNFVLLIASISAGIGLMNLFPIPMLDGGHLVFYAYEAVFRRKMNDRILNGLMIVGVSIVGSFMVFAIFNDLFLCP